MASEEGDTCSGYDEQKRQIEDTVLLALLHPEVYEEVARGTRRFAADNMRPRAVLFEGPPGCGKTTSARCSSLMSLSLLAGALLSQQPHKRNLRRSSQVRQCSWLPVPVACDGCKPFADPHVHALLLLTCLSMFMVQARQHQ